MEVPPLNYNILFTSCGRRSYLLDYFKKCLDNNSTIHASNSENCPAFNSADKFVLSPLIEKDHYIEFILDYCIKHSIKIIIPLFDSDLFVLSKNKKIFQKYNIEIIVSDFDIINVCNDKFLTYKFLKKNKLKTPETAISFDEIINKLDKKVINYPLILKPRYGMGSLGIYEAKNIDEFLIFNKKLKNELKNSDVFNVFNSVGKENIIYQEKIIGIEYGANIINNLNCNYINTLCLKKNKMRFGETDSAKVIKDLEIEQIGMKISLKLKHKFLLDVDIIKNKDGENIIIELNNRFGGQYPFFHEAGSNLPLALIKMINKVDYISNKHLKVKEGFEGYKDISIKTLSK